MERADIVVAEARRGLLYLKRVEGLVSGATAAFEKVMREERGAEPAATDRRTLRSTRQAGQ